MNEPTDWASAIAILAGGLFLGALIVFFFSRRKSSSPASVIPDLERKDLEAKRDSLVAQLRALDEENVEERMRLETETADVLRKLDNAPQAPLPAAQPKGEGPGETTRPAMNPAMKGFLWGAGSFAALAGLAFLVMNQATPRQEGGSLTGDIPMAQQQASQTNPIVMQLEAAVQKDPNNLQLRNDLAQAYLETDNLMAVFEQTKVVLAKSPTDSRALTFQALVRMAMGEAEAATQMLQQATKSDPRNLDAWVSLAWVYVQQKKLDEAEKMIAEAAKQSPNDKARLEDVFRQMKAQAAGAPAEPTPAQIASGELPAGHPPIDGAPAPAQAPAARPAAPADGKSVSVTLELDPAAAQKSGVLFVMARNPMGGPPVAVKRMQVASFPITFDFGSADSMMGQPLPDKFRLEARLDSDGDAATKPPTDPSAIQNDVAPGTTVKLALK
ncbi:MAG: tetratricopeptide repeat protein [Thermoanaerobaculia bacterium]